MTDRDLGRLLASAQQLEQDARLGLTSPDQAERAAALDAVRQARGLERVLERWIAGRATRAVQA